MADTIIGTLRAILTLDSSQYTKGTNEAVKATGNLDSGLVNLTAGLYALETGYRYAKQAADLYVGAATDAYSSVAQFQRMTGASVNEAGRWHDMLEKMGLDLTDLTATMRIFSNNVDAAFNNPDSASAKAFGRLNISLTDSNGKLKDTNTLILETLTALGHMQNGAEKTALSVDTLGRNAQSLSKAFDEGTDAMSTFNETQTDITSEGMKNFKEYKKSVDEFNASLTDIEATVGTRLMPFLSGLANLIKTNVLPAIEAILDKFEYLGYVVGAIQNGDQIDDYETYIERRRLYNLNLAYTDSQSNPRIKTGDKVIVTNIEPIDTIGGGTGGYGGSGGSGGGGGGSHNYTWATAANSMGAGIYKIREERIDPATGQRSPALYGNATTGAVSTNLTSLVQAISPEQFTQMSGYDQTLAIKNGYNPYAGNTTGGTVPPITGTTTYEASFGQMLNKLSKVSGLSPSAKAVITKYNSMGSNTSQAQQDISTLRSRPNSPEAQAIIARVLKERGPMAGDSSVEGTIDYLEAGLTSGAIHNQYIYPTGNEFNTLKSDWDRLTGGSHPTLDANGNVIVYVTIDGQEVAKAVVNKLALLGVSV